jgi:uncharacterized protein YbaR (Trm112 family)
MKPIHSQEDFTVMLHAERAVVSLFFEWSAQAKLSQQMMEQWERELAAQPDKINFSICQLAPDSHPFAWKWVNEAIGHSAEMEHGCGLVTWLKNGSVVGFVPDAARAGIKRLTRMTHDCFVLGKSFDVSGATSPGETSLDVELLKILCCPETQQSLSLAASALLEKLNAQIAAGRLTNRGGDTVLDHIDAGLVRADGKYLYPVRGNISIMLMEEAIPMTM